MNTKETQPIFVTETNEDGIFVYEYWNGTYILRASYYHEDLMSEDLVEWMTEPTNPNMAPRSDNG